MLCQHLTGYIRLISDQVKQSRLTYHQITLYYKLCITRWHVHCSNESSSSAVPYGRCARNLPAPSHKELVVGARVVAKWPSDNYYYMGMVVQKDRGMYVISVQTLLASILSSKFWLVLLQFVCTVTICKWKAAHRFFSLMFCWRSYHMPMKLVHVCFLVAASTSCEALKGVLY